MVPRAAARWCVTSSSASCSPCPAGTSSTRAWASSSRPGSWTGCSDGQPRPAHGRLRVRPHPGEPALRRHRRAPRHLRRRPAGHRPGHGGGAAAARDLRPRADLGLHHVRRHLLRRHVRRLDDRDPAQHTGRVRVGDDGPRGQPAWHGPDGPRRRSPPRRSAPSSPARSARSSSCSSPRHWPIGGGRDRRTVLLRPDGAGDGHGHQRARRIAAARLHRALPRPHHRPGRPRPQHRPVAAELRPAAAGGPHRRGRRRGRHLRPGRGLLGRRTPATQPRPRHPGRTAVDEPRRPQAVVGTVAARHGVRLPVRRAAGRRRGDPDVPVLHHREADRRPQGPRRVRRGRDRGRGRPGGGQQRLGRRHLRPAARAGPSRDGHRLPSCWPPCRDTASSPVPG